MTNLCVASRFKIPFSVKPQQQRYCNKQARVMETVAKKVETRLLVRGNVVNWFGKNQLLITIV